MAQGRKGASISGATPPRPSAPLPTLLRARSTDGCVDATARRRDVGADGPSRRAARGSQRSLRPTARDGAEKRSHFSCILPSHAPSARRRTTS